ncbi:MAG: hypothetical protein KDC83_06685 [Flavobacteriales bacterium]|nr:hypothetical protein [Flavobacteriales bacterium]
MSLEVLLLGNQEFEIRGVELNYFGGELEVIGEDVFSRSFDQINPNGLPIVLTLTGKGVLHKAILPSEGSPIESAFPQIRQEDFVSQAYTYSEKTWVAILRAEIYAEVLSAINKFDLSVIDLFLGPFSSIPHLSESFSVSKYNFGFEGQLLSEVKGSDIYSDKPITFQEETIPAARVLAYFSGLNFLFQFIPPLSESSDGLNQEKDNFLEKKFLRHGGIAALALTLLALVVNFSWYNSLDKELSNLAFNKMQVEQKLKDWEAREKQAEAQRLILSKINYERFSNQAKIIDQVGSVCLSGIRLTSVNVHPLKEDLSKRNGIEFSSNTILINGEVESSGAFNDFMQRLKGLGITSALEVLDYSKTERSKRYEFVIKGDLYAQ